MAVIDYTGQIIAINNAIAAGVTSVSYEGKSATYRSFDEMIQTVAYLERQQTRANGQRVPISGVASFSKFGRHRWCR